MSYSGRGHRFFIGRLLSYEFKFGATTLSIFWEGRSRDASYTYSGDMNGDGATGNDLIYIARDTSRDELPDVHAGGRTFTAAEQATAWDAYIDQDSYLSTHRGQYAERNGVLLPMVWRMDFSVSQDLFKNLGGARHSLQFRMDIHNFTNLLNRDWGVGQRLVGSTTTPPFSSQALVYPGRGRPGQGPLPAAGHQQPAALQVAGDHGLRAGRLPHPVQPALHLQLARTGPLLRGPDGKFPVPALASFVPLGRSGGRTGARV